MTRLLTLPEAAARAEAIRAAGQTLVFTNGIFDLLHPGHVDYLERARALGDALYVGVNTDDSARALKGESRPFLPAADRARMVAALRCVDAVLLFPELTAETLIRALRPAIYAKGADYADKHLPERELVERLGGRVVLIPLREGFSTSELIALLKRSDTEHGIRKT